MTEHEQSIVSALEAAEDGVEAALVVLRARERASDPARESGQVAAAQQAEAEQILSRLEDLIRSVRGD